MSYAKAMKHHNNPRKWRRTRVKDGRGMSAAGKRGNALIFGKPITEPRVVRVGQTVQWWRDGVLMTATVLSAWKRGDLLLVESDALGTFYVQKEQVLR